jgi:hypothetical protein
MRYELKVEIQGIEPPIWRLIQVPSHITLEKLHRVIQKAMGWTGSHLHLFRVNGKKYGEPGPEWGFELKDESKITLEEIFSTGRNFLIYEYDMGDCWVHEIELTREIDGEYSSAACVTGERACPPEDCGGVIGYQALVEAVSDPGHEEHVSIMEWLGGSFDPEAFDAAAVDRALKMLR